MLNILYQGAQGAGEIANDLINDLENYFNGPGGRNFSSGLCTGISFRMLFNLAEALGWVNQETPLFQSIVAQIVTILGMYMLENGWDFSHFRDFFIGQQLGNNVGYAIFPLIHDNQAAFFSTSAASPPSLPSDNTNHTPAAPLLRPD